jgi:hypothetical protein
MWSNQTACKPVGCSTRVNSDRGVCIVTIRHRGVFKPARKPDKRSDRIANRTLWQTVGHALSSWSGVFRVILLVTIPIVIVLVAAWVFHLAIEAGPVKITHS